MRIVLVLLFGFVRLTTLAQTESNPPQKIGHADWEYIFSQLPEYKQIENDLKTHESQLQNQLKAKYFFLIFLQLILFFLDFIQSLLFHGLGEQYLFGLIGTVESLHFFLHFFNFLLPGS